MCGPPQLAKIIEADRKAKELAAIKAMRPATLDLDEDAKQRKKAGKSTFGTMGKDRASIQVTVDKVQTYDEAFAKIQEATGIGNIDELVTAFINAEDQNFTLFNYVNELNKEIEKLEEQVAEMQGDAQKQQGESATDDGRRARVVALLEEKLASCKASCEGYELKWQQSTAVMESLKGVIQRTFKGIGCDTAATRDLLGEDGVSEANIMQYLGIVEQRANEILQFYSNRRSRSRGSQASGLDGPRVSNSQPTAGPGTTLSSLAIEPPSTTMEEFEEEEGEHEAADDDHPMTRDELQARWSPHPCICHLSCRP